MAQCRNCGAPLAEEDTFCGNCGTPVAPAAPKESFAETLNDLKNTPDTTAFFTPEDRNQNRAFGILAYLGPLVLIPIFAARESKFARFHANQGLLLLICSGIVSVAGSVTNGLIKLLRLGFFGGVLRFLVGTAVAAASVGLTVLMVMGIVAAARGRAKELPIIGKYRILK